LAVYNLLYAHDNGKLVDNERCRVLTDAFVCASVFQLCNETAISPSEPVPVLPCQSFCQEVWDSCSAAYNSFLLIVLGKEHYVNATMPMCGPAATFSTQFIPTDATPLPADRFGSRLYPSHPIYPMGYYGELKYPEKNATYTSVDKTTKAVMNCIVPTNISAQLDATYVGVSATGGIPGGSTPASSSMEMQSSLLVVVVVAGTVMVMALMQ
jgi:hypothetical protein